MLQNENAAKRSAFQAAQKLQGAGQSEAALAAFQKLVKRYPKMAQAQFQIARILMDKGKHAAALPHMQAARNSAPREVMVWQGLLAVLLALNDKAGQKQFGKDLAKAPLPAAQIKALRKQMSGTSAVSLGGAPKAEVDALIGALTGKRSEEALILAADLHQRYPKVAIITNALATAYEQNGREDAAHETFKLAISQSPSAPQPLTNYARFLSERLDHPGAISCLKRACKLAPNNLDIQLQLAKSFYSAKETAAALPLAEAILEKQPENIVAMQVYADSLLDLHRTDEAMPVLNHIISLDNNFGGAFASRGKIHQILGAFEAAKSDFYRAIELDPKYLDTYRQLARIHTFQKDDPLIGIMSKLFEDPQIPEANKNSLGYALAKAHEDTGAYQKAFPYLVRANEIERARAPYDASEISNRLEQAREQANAYDYAANDREQFSDFAPIILSGLPRSGTTLSEQILTTHSQVTAAGETTWAAETFMIPRNRTAQSFQQLFGEPDALAKAGAQYETLARAFLPDAPIILDKALGQHWLIGLLKAALPRCKFVMMRRDPRDNLLSLYKNQFRLGVDGFNNSLRDLAQAYAEYVQILKFWQQVLPEGSVYELQYEKLIEAPEEQIGKLLDFCGLAWEDQLLQFHKTKREVRTLSTFQVRQPIYQTSKNSWQNYREELAPLLAALEEFGVAPEDLPD